MQDLRNSSCLSWSPSSDRCHPALACELCRGRTQWLAGWYCPLSGRLLWPLTWCCVHCDRIVHESCLLLAVHKPCLADYPGPVPDVCRPGPGYCLWPLDCCGAGPYTQVVFRLWSPQRLSGSGSLSNGVTARDSAKSGDIDLCAHWVAWYMFKLNSIRIRNCGQWLGNLKGEAAWSLGS